MNQAWKRRLRASVLTVWCERVPECGSNSPGEQSLRLLERPLWSVKAIVGDSRATVEPPPDASSGGRVTGRDLKRLSAGACPRGHSSCWGRGIAAAKDPFVGF